jgi:hypothetical protein
VAFPGKELGKSGVILHKNGQKCLDFKGKLQPFSILLIALSIASILLEIEMES